MKRNTLFIILGILVGICLLTAIFSALAFRTYFSLRNDKAHPVTASGVEKQTLRLERPEKPLMVEDSAVACIRDIRGGEVQLYDYRSVCLENRDVIDYQGAWLREVFEDPRVIPVKKANGLIMLINIDHIREYFFDGEQCHVTLREGGIADGYPVGDYSVSGRSGMGDISLMMNDLHMAVFNPKKTADNPSAESIFQSPKSVNKNPNQVIYHGGGYWPGESAEKIKITMQNDLTDMIDKPVFVYQMNGCDRNWIPCKPFTTWKITEYFPVQTGLIKAKIKLTDIITLDFNTRNDSLYADISMKNGKHLSGAELFQGAGLIDTDYSYLVGILGVSQTGFVYVRLKEIKSITLM